VFLKKCEESACEELDPAQILDLFSDLVILKSATSSHGHCVPGRAERELLRLRRPACAKRLRQEHAEGMTDREDFLAWVKSALYEAERAVHNGDLGPRRALWSRNEPVSVLGAWRNAYGRPEVDEAFTFLERSFSDCTSFTFELQAYDVVGDMAYTAGLEHISNSFDGQPRSLTLRATQVYRRESGEWKVAHRHADFLTYRSPTEGGSSGSPVSDNE
jgi:ketosteroid isomerase-like protein